MSNGWEMLEGPTSSISSEQTELQTGCAKTARGGTIRGIALEFPYSGARGFFYHRDWRSHEEGNRNSRRIAFSKFPLNGVAAAWWRRRWTTRRWWCSRGARRSCSARCSTGAELQSSRRRRARSRARACTFPHSRQARGSAQRRSAQRTREERSSA